MKKIICLFLITLLVVAAVPLSVFAEPDPTASPQPTESASPSPTQSTSPSPSPTQSTPSPTQPSTSPSPSESAKLTEPKVTVSTNPTELAAGGSVELTVRVENTAGESNPLKNVSISVDGSKAFSIDQIKKAYNYRNAAYSISSSKLGKQIPVVVTYSFEGHSSNSVSKSFTIKKGAGTVSISTMAKADKTTIKEGESVSFSFSIENNSNISIENAKLTASNLNGGKQIGETFSLAAGKPHLITYSEQISSSMTIQPKLTYTAGGKQYTANLDVISITVGNPAVDFVITPASTSVNTGDELTVDVSITNTGNVDFESFYVYDCLDNMVAIEQETLKMGESVSASHTMMLSETTDIDFYIAAQDADGNEYDFRSNKVTVEAGTLSGDELAGMLTLDVTTDKNTLEEPGDVLFSLTLENKSSQPFTNIVISEETLGEIESYTSFPNGKKVLSYNVKDISDSMSFIFSVTATAPDGSAVSFAVPSIEITVENGSGGISWLTIVLIIVIVLIVATAAVLIILVLREKNGGGNGGNGGRSGKNVGSKVSSGRSKSSSSGEGFFASVFGGKKSRGGVYYEEDIQYPGDRRPPIKKNPAAGRGADVRKPQSYNMNAPEPQPSDNIYKRGSRNYVQGTASSVGARRSFEPLEADAPSADEMASVGLDAQEAYNEPSFEEPVIEEKAGLDALSQEKGHNNAEPRRVQVKKRYTNVKFDDHNDF